MTCLSCDIISGFPGDLSGRFVQPIRLTQTHQRVRTRVTNYTNKHTHQNNNHHVLHPIIPLSDAGAAEGVGLDDVSSSQQILLQRDTLTSDSRDHELSFIIMYVTHRHLVNAEDDVRLCDAQNVIVSFQTVGMIFKLFTSEIFFLKVPLLDHGSHSTVQNQNPLLQECPELIVNTN